MPRFERLRRYGIRSTSIGNLSPGDSGAEIRLQNFGVCQAADPLGAGIGSVIREVIGIHVLLIRSLFACDIPRRFLLRVSLAKPTSAPVRF
jgi:hypothetical protein